MELVPWLKGRAVGKCSIFRLARWQLRFHKGGAASTRGEGRWNRMLGRRASTRLAAIAQERQVGGAALPALTEMNQERPGSARPSQVCTGQ